LEQFLGAGLVNADDSARDREFWRRMQDVTAEAISPRGEIRLRCRATTGWEVDIAPGTLETLRESRFLNVLETAAHTLVANYRTRVVLLTDEVYGTVRPRSRAADRRS
jgi:hypothetical protein